MEKNLHVNSVTSEKVYYPPNFLETLFTRACSLQVPALTNTLITDTTKTQHQICTVQGFCVWRNTNKLTWTTALVLWGENKCKCRTGIQSQVPTLLSWSLSASCARKGKQNLTWKYRKGQMNSTLGNNSYKNHNQILTSNLSNDQYWCLPDTTHLHYLIICQSTVLTFLLKTTPPPANTLYIW